MNEYSKVGSPADLSAVSLLKHYRDRTLSPVDVVRAVLERIDVWEPHIRATYALNADAALTEAAASEARWLRSKPAGALDGVPVTVKENVASKGVPLPMGSAATPLVPATEDAPVMARLREAGAILITKTTMPDYGLLASSPSSFHPLTRNPWDVTKTPGGSSSGAAAAAAAGYGPLHVGTDIGGSIRIPAGFCGVFGLKPSWGRVPIYPSFLFRVCGPLTRDVTDAALMMQVLTLPDERDYMSLPYQSFDWSDLALPDLKGMRLGLLIELKNGMPVDPEIVGAVTDAARAFEAQGAIIDIVENWVDPEMSNGFSTFMHTRAVVDMENLEPEQQEKLHPLLRAALMRKPEMSDKELYRAYLQVLALRQKTNEVTRRYDFILSPVSPVQAFSAESWCADPARGVMYDTTFTSVHNVSEQPAASINCGYTASGLPIGLQIAGRRFDDLGVLRLARAWEMIRTEQRPWPRI